jgi:hypothetical protein
MDKEQKHIKVSIHPFTDWQKVKIADALRKPSPPPLWKKVLNYLWTKF